MTDTQLKFKLVFIPFLLIELGYAACYSFFNWCLFIQQGWLKLDEVITLFIIPAAIAVIPMLIWLRPRIQLLDLTAKRGKNPVAGFILIATMAAVATTLTAQNYLVTATGKLTQLQRIDEINKYPLTKYYTLQQHFVSRGDTCIYRRRHVSGKHNSELNFDDYIVCPVYPSAQQTQLKNAWVGMHYSKRVSNRLSYQEKEQAYQIFQQTSLADFKQRDLDAFVYLDRLGYNDNQKYYLKAVKLHQYVDSGIYIFEAYNRPFANHNGNNLWWLLLAFAAGSLVFWLVLNASSMDARKMEAFG